MAHDNRDNNQVQNVDFAKVVSTKDVGCIAKIRGDLYDQTKFRIKKTT